ncbi:splicing factor [Coemansia sp. RSA 990]|nr:hypothetical protein BX667DRAFT_391857 [Coemansia mojavensis]KAJ1739159.1 splicing factor [Coemansia sp. RSA 1086]KAJ1869633.1 splicing factor [Coemansia sp. RSA 990]KAJ2667943.1 splicing factor [Coemansia sp. RSA 1085]
MAEEIDVDALLDAPFKNSKVVEEQSSAKKAADVSSTNAKVDPAHAEPVEDRNVASRDIQRRLGRSRSRTSRSRHRSRHSHRHDDDRHYSDYRRSRRSDDSPRDRYRGRHYDRYEQRSSHRSPSRRRRRRRSSSLIRSRSASRERKSRRRSPSPEVDESERDLRTVFAMQLSPDLRRRDLVEFFSQVGRVRDAHIVSEKGSRRSRGVAYVEFYAVESAMKAVSLSGQRLLNVPIIVQPSEAEKNRKNTVKQYSADGAPLAASTEENTLVVVRELMVDMDPADMRRFFELFGIVEHCRVAPMPAEAASRREPTEWTAYVKLNSPTAARRAVDKLHGMELFGARLRVRMARKSEQEHEKRHFAENKTPANTRAPRIQSPMNVTPDKPYEVMLLKNMVNPEEETEENWRAELEEDVKGECVKFGSITRVFIDSLPDCNIYVQFGNISSANNAQRSMNGRWFGGRQISAELVSNDHFLQRLSVH